jgi:hypothetical protein
MQQQIIAKGNPFNRAGRYFLWFLIASLILLAPGVVRAQDGLFRAGNENHPGGTFS